MEVCEALFSTTIIKYHIRVRRLETCCQSSAELENQWQEAVLLVHEGLAPYYCNAHFSLIAMTKRIDRL